MTFSFLYYFIVLWTTEYCRTCCVSGVMYWVHSHQSTEFVSESSREAASWPGDGLRHVHGPQEQHRGRRAGMWDRMQKTRQTWYRTCPFFLVASELWCRWWRGRRGSVGQWVSVWDADPSGVHMTITISICWFVSLEIILTWLLFWLCGITLVSVNLVTLR